MPAFILVKLNRTRVLQLRGLEEGIIPIEPVTTRMQIKITSGAGGFVTKTVHQRQILITGTYVFTDYQAQGQMLEWMIADVAKPPYGRLSLFNMYVALSQGRGRENIQLLRGFEEETLMKDHNADLMIEDGRLERLDEGRWKGKG